jgi:uncharacterized protein
MTVTIDDNPEETRYEVWEDGQLAGFAHYALGEGRITFIHTEIEPEYEGAGLGSRLARFALDDARQRGLAVVPRCPFIAGYIHRHPDEYLDLVTPELRERVRHGGRRE